MISELLQSVSFFRVLHCIDQDLAEACRQAGCPFCQGPLHRAAYLRKPRGGPQEIPEEYQVRLSLCCGRQDCRRRVLPPSCLFLGRKVYWSAVIVVALSLRQQRLGGYSINRLQRMFSISRNTLIRWRHYFSAEFPSSTTWQRLRGRVIASVRDQGLPGSLVEHFLDHHNSRGEALVGCLRFLALGQVK